LCLATEGGVEKEGKEDGEVRRPGQDGDDDDEPEEEEDLELDDYENAGIPPEDFYQTTVSQRDTIWAGGIGGLQPSPLHAMGVSIRDTFPGKIGVFRGKKERGTRAMASGAQQRGASSPTLPRATRSQLR